MRSRVVAGGGARRSRIHGGRVTGFRHEPSPTGTFDARRMDAANDDFDVDAAFRAR